MLEGTVDPILDQTLDCLKWHFHPEWGDRTLLDVFNRLLAKNLKPKGWRPDTHLNLQSHQIRSESVQRTAAQLVSLGTAHSRDRPIRTDVPIIIAIYDGKERLLDGNTRINFWTRNGDLDLHTVHFHHIDAVRQFSPLD